jgi:hypothetical protein
MRCAHTRGPAGRLIVGCVLVALGQAMVRDRREAQPFGGVVAPGWMRVADITLGDCEENQPHYLHM